MTGKRVLVVDDEESVRWALTKALERAGYAVDLAADGPSGTVAAESPAVDLVLLDVRLPGRDGLAVLRDLRKRRPDLPVIMMTAYGTLQVAVEAMKQGAYDYIGKPFDVDEVLLVVEKALEAQALAREVSELRQKAEERFDLGGIVGGSPAMQQIFKAVGKVAGTDLTVLLRGESGTGKELIARAVHENSRRKGRPFVPVNCAAIPRELLESELFGHEKGAFTGAVAARARPLRAGGRRDGLPGRDRRHGPQPPDQAAAGPAGAADRAPGRGGIHPRGRPHRGGHQPGPEAAVAGAPFARTCSTGSTSCRSTCRRCVTGGRHSRPGAPLPGGIRTRSAGTAQAVCSGSVGVAVALFVAR